MDCVLPCDTGALALLCCSKNGENNFGFLCSSRSGNVAGCVVLTGANAVHGDVIDDEIAIAMSSDAAAIVFVMVSLKLTAYRQ